MFRVLLTILLFGVSTGAIDTGMDNEICSAAPDLVLDYSSNYAGYWTVPTNECRTLIKFDVAPSPETAEIYLTTFRRWKGNVYAVYEIAEAWKSNVTWSTQPAIGDKVAEFTITDAEVYMVEVSNVPAFGWLIKNDSLVIPPVEIWSFESDDPPRLEFPNRVTTEAESFGKIKAIYR